MCLLYRKWDIQNVLLLGEREMDQIKQLKKELSEKNRLEKEIKESLVELFRLFLRGSSIDSNFILKKARHLFEELDKNGDDKQYIDGKIASIKQKDHSFFIK